MRAINRLCFNCFLHISILLAVLVIQPSTSSAQDTPDPPPDQSAQVESLMAGLSDEQVRQMLISELRSDSLEDQYTEQQGIAGPAGIFHRILNKFSIEHNDNEKQLGKLWGGIPNVIPDLHKVFLSL